MANRGKIVRPCIVCGADVHGWPSDFEKYNKKYCSNACRAADVCGEKHHRWNPRITKICESCGKEFEVIPCFKDQKYCSRSCFGHAHRMEPVRASCEGCGILYEVSRGSRGRFHSVECYQRWRKEGPKGIVFSA